MRTAVVIPNWNGGDWLPGCLDAVADQSHPPDRTIVVDNGSSDGSAAGAARAGAELVELGSNRGFAAAANAGLAHAADCDAVALVNTDVLLDPDWLARMTTALASDPDAGAVAGKMVSLRDPGMIDDAGDFLRRDGVCEQRGRFRPDTGRFDVPGEVFSACAGAALYRREAVAAADGFDERFVTYLEDVELGLRLRLGGWTCLYEPAVARHAGGASAVALDPPPQTWIERNTLLLVAKHFPLRWLPAVLYRQIAWIWNLLARDPFFRGPLRHHLRGIGRALPALPAALRQRRAMRRTAKLAIADVVPARPFRGPAAGGHPESPE